MLKNQNRNIFLTAVFLFVITQTLIFASIPRESNGEQINVIVKSGTGLWDIAGKLKDADLIYSSSLFVLCTLPYRGKLIAGEYALKKDMSIIDIVQKMGRGERNIYTLKIIEGHNLHNIAESTEKSAITGSEDFLRLAKDQGLLQRLSIKGDSLEGYLAPDTYYYSKGRC
jgi:UPF0755 protein